MLRKPPECKRVKQVSVTLSAIELAEVNDVRNTYYVSLAEIMLIGTMEIKATRGEKYSLVKRGEINKVIKDLRQKAKQTGDKKNERIQRHDI